MLKEIIKWFGSQVELARAVVALVVAAVVQHAVHMPLVLAV